MKNEELEELGQELANKMSKLINYSGGAGQKAFLDKMSRDHRTLQQSFNRLCLQRLEDVAEKKGPMHIDARNEMSQKIAEKMMKGFIRIIAEEQNLSEEEIVKNWDIYKPSKWLSHI